MLLHEIAQRIEHLAYPTICHHALGIAERYSHAVEIVFCGLVLNVLIVCSRGIGEILGLDNNDGFEYHKNGDNAREIGP